MTRWIEWSWGVTRLIIKGGRAIRSPQIDLRMSVFKLIILDPMPLLLGWT